MADAPRQPDDSHERDESHPEPPTERPLRGVPLFDAAEKVDEVDIGIEIEPETVGDSPLPTPGATIMAEVDESASSADSSLQGQSVARGGEFADHPFSTAPVYGMISGSGIESMMGRQGGEPAVAAPLHRPRRAGAVGAWLLMLLCLLLALPALIVQLTGPEVFDVDEAREIATTIHSWQRPTDPAATGFSVERFAPYFNGRERYDVLPGTTWAHFVGLWLGELSGPIDTLPQYIYCIRLVSVFCALLVIASVFWTGYAIGGLKTGGFAALVCASLPVLLWYGRLGTTPIIHTALAMLAIASAVWAIRPLRPSPSIERQFIGWVVCGLAMGGAMLTVGPLAFLTITFPIVLILLLCPGRTSHILGLFAALLIACLIVLPWAIFAHDHNQDAWAQWIKPFDAPLASNIEHMSEQAGSRAALLIFGSLPWTLWLIGAAVQPFSTSSVGVRTRMFIGWGWFLYLLVLFLLLPGGGRASDLLPVLPVTAVLIGQLFRQYSDLAAQGWFARFWRWLRWPHLFVLLAVSLLVPIAVFAQPFLLQHTDIERPLFGATSPWFAIGLLGILILLALLSGNWMVRQYPGRVLICWSVWVLGLVSTSIVPLVSGDWLKTDLRNDAQVIARVAGDTPTYWLVTPTGEARESDDPDPRLMLYADRLLRTIADPQLPEAAKQEGAFYVIGVPNWPLSKTDNHPIEEVARLQASGLVLWRYGEAPPAVTAR